MTQEMRIGFTILNYAQMRGLTKKQLADKLEVSETTIANRIKRPGGWKLCELVRAYEVLEIPKEERWV